MKKTFKSYAIIWALLLVVFNAIAFVSPGWADYEKYTASFWISYAFILLAFIGQFACAYKVFQAKNLTKLFYNLPLYSVSYTGLIVSFVMGGLCMLFYPLPYWVGAIVGMAVLTLTAIAVVKADTVAELVNDIDEKIKTKTSFIRSLSADAEGLISQAKSAEAKAACKKVYEAVRYSDPMSHTELAEIEDEIAKTFSTFLEAIVSDHLESVTALAEKLVILIGERNKKGRALK